MLGAVLFGHEQMQVVIQAIKELAAEVNKPIVELPDVAENAELKAAVESACGDAMRNAYTVADKMDRYAAIDAAKAAAKDALCGGDEPAFSEDEVGGAIDKLKKSTRGRILAGEPRIDGRDTAVRPISIRTGVLPRTHGSALFTRGETQAMVVTTLGTERDSQIIDALEGSFKENFMLHYNFPPFCVGELGRVGSPKRREIGHGRLAKRGVLACMPDMEDFPHSIRVVSEITESNSSSSMASVCGTACR